MGEGKHPTEEHLLKLASKASIPIKEAKLIIEQTRDAISQWNSIAKQTGVSHDSRISIQKILNQL